jgi:ArsR family transcriptional regulator
VHVKLPSVRALSAASELFRALGDVSRLVVLLRLASGPRCVGELAEETGAPLSTLSQQLKVLHHARLVSRRREGKHVHYALADEHVRELVAAAIDHANEAGQSPAREERA